MPHHFPRPPANEERQQPQADHDQRMDQVLCLPHHDRLGSETGVKSELKRIWNEAK